jgi:hypothetical protein
MNSGGVITITGTIITVAAAANASVVAPLTQVIGVYAPYVTPVRAGEVFREEIRVSLPIEPRLAGGKIRMPRPSANCSYQHVQFVPEYYFGGVDVRERIDRFGEYELIVPQFPTGARPSIAEWASPVTSMELPVFDPSES